MNSCSIQVSSSDILRRLCSTKLQDKNFSHRSDELFSKQSSKLSAIFVTQPLETIPVRCFFPSLGQKRFQSARKLLDFQHHLFKNCTIDATVMARFWAKSHRERMLNFPRQAINARHNNLSFIKSCTRFSR